MLLIRCPYCAEGRDESEFSYGGEADIKRPNSPAETSDEAWGDYLFFRTNARGEHAELWYHAAGCRRFFRAVRNTVSYRIERTGRLNEPTDGQVILP